MRIAVISDVHANLPALEEVLKGIDTQKVDAIYCLGDLVNQNVWNNEVVELIRERKILTLKGNHDAGIAAGKHLFPFSYTFPEAKQWGKEAIEYTLAHITDDNRYFLSRLPASYRFSISNKDKKSFCVRMAHGIPEGINEKLYYFTSKEHFAGLMKQAGVDMLITGGNSHCPSYYRISVKENGIASNRYVVNPGSAGRPKDGDWRSCYAIISLDTTRSLHDDEDAVQVDFYRIKYDLDKVVKAIKKSSLPVYYGGCLITG